MIGETLGGRYVILRLLGQGGMGAVYEARHTGTDRRVAVKVITSGLEARPAMLARFEVEARAAGKIESRHIAQVFDVGKDEQRGGLPYLVMEFLVGEDMQQVLRRLGPLPPALAVRIVAQACLGLEKAHQGGIIHRDIKPANLFLTAQEDDTFIVKTLDFGVAKIRHDDALMSGEGGLTNTGALLGSPLYMSPEQARGHKTLDARSDVWALGIVLYQALTGQTPFHHIDAMGELIIHICSTPAPPVEHLAPWVDPRLARVVQRALEIPLERRFQSARELYHALKELCRSTSIEASMLIGLGDDDRANVLPLAGPTPPPGYETAAFTQSNPYQQSGPYQHPGMASGMTSGMSSGERLPIAGSTQAGTSMSASGVGRGGSRSKKPILIMAGLGVAIGAVAAFYFQRTTADTTAAHAGETATATAATSAASEAPQPPASAAPSAQASAAQTTTPSAETSAAAEAPSASAAATSPEPVAGSRRSAATQPRGTAKAKPTPSAAPSAAPAAAAQPTAAANVGGRVIRTDLP